MSSGTTSELPVADRLSFDDDEIIHTACDDGPRNASRYTVHCCGAKIPDDADLEDYEPGPGDIVCPLCPTIPLGMCACFYWS